MLKFSERAYSIYMVFMIGISIAIGALQQGKHGRREEGGHLASSLLHLIPSHASG